ncbi:unnamed protein product [Cunninghamella blakesleeana]
MTMFPTKIFIEVAKRKRLSSEFVKYIILNDYFELDPLSSFDLKPLYDTCPNANIIDANTFSLLDDNLILLKFPNWYPLTMLNF